MGIQSQPFLIVASLDFCSFWNRLNNGQHFAIWCKTSCHLDTQLVPFFGKWTICTIICHFCRITKMDHLAGSWVLLTCITLVVQVLNGKSLPQISCAVSDSNIFQWCLALPWTHQNFMLSVTIATCSWLNSFTWCSLDQPNEYLVSLENWWQWHITSVFFHIL